jgi:zinc protease
MKSRLLGATVARRASPGLTHSSQALSERLLDGPPLQGRELERGKPQARSAQQPASIPDIPYTKFDLKNGLTLLVHEDHKAPIAAVNVWYHVGSKNEKPGRTGFAHLFEHLMFNGSEHYNNDYFKAVEPSAPRT